MCSTNADSAATNGTAASDTAAAPDATTPDDRTAKARIRDAAVACIAEHGLAAATVRRVADAAGVSPGLVIHHFGSMDGLRSACDDFVAATIRQIKADAAAQGPGIDVLSAVREADTGPLGGYLAAVLAEDSPAVARLVDDLIADAEDYLQQFVDAGMMRPAAEPGRRAAVLVLWSLGAMVMHKHLRRILGVDVTAPDAPSDPEFIAYTRSIYEIIGEGIFTEEFAARARDSLAAGEKPSEAATREDAS